MRDIMNTEQRDSRLCDFSTLTWGRENSAHISRTEGLRVPSFLLSMTPSSFSMGMSALKPAVCSYPAFSSVNGAKISRILPAQTMFAEKNLIFFQLCKKNISIILLLFSTNNSIEVEKKKQIDRKK
jgi:hypothetical protein